MFKDFLIFNAQNFIVMGSGRVYRQSWSASQVTAPP
jgi:hypothetical protein